MEFLGHILLILAVGLACTVLNPLFWQGLRNSKFIDDMKKHEEDKSKEKDIINPDEE